MDCEKDQTGKIERGGTESNHRKVTGFEFSQGAKRQIMTVAAHTKTPNRYFFTKKNNNLFEIY